MATAPRPPAVAGQFYEADGAKLAHQVEGCFTDPRGPGRLPPRHRSLERRIRAAVVPHAGFQYSGAIAARAFYALSEERSPSTVLLLGVDHHGNGGPGALSDRPWATPLGIVPVDHELVRALARAPITIDEHAQASEHSLEVELPFLQYVEPAPRIAALQVRFGPYEQLRQIADIVRSAIRGRDVLLIASTDFSHYVPAETARRLDGLAIERIRARDAEALYQTVARERISMCGLAPTTVLLAALADEPLEAVDLGWGHSGEAAAMGEVVGYASLLLRSAVPIPKASA
ncbi:MAG: AmmeMemoRadiSam system protein B [Thermoplasmata archaeon]|nr:AmmeMemoRadiSam system protein B [Thermoplasmata archaeon]